MSCSRRMASARQRFPGPRVECRQPSSGSPARTSTAAGTLRSGDDVHAVARAVDEVDVRHPRRAEHDRRAPGRAEARVRGTIVRPVIGLGLDDARRAPDAAVHVDEHLARGGPSRHRARVARVELARELQRARRRLVASAALAPPCLDAPRVHASARRVRVPHPRGTYRAGRRREPPRAGARATLGRARRVGYALSPPCLLALIFAGLAFAPGAASAQAPRETTPPSPRASRPRGGASASAAGGHAGAGAGPGPVRRGLRGPDAPVHRVRAGPPGRLILSADVGWLRSGLRADLGIAQPARPRLPGRDAAPLRPARRAASSINVRRARSRRSRAAPFALSIEPSVGQVFAPADSVARTSRRLRAEATAGRGARPGSSSTRASECAGSARAARTRAGRATGIRRRRRGAYRRVIVGAEGSRSGSRPSLAGLGQWRLRVGYRALAPRSPRARRALASPARRSDVETKPFRITATRSSTARPSTRSRREGASAGTGRVVDASTLVVVGSDARRRAASRGGRRSRSTGAPRRTWRSRQRLDGVPLSVRASAEPTYTGPVGEPLAVPELPVATGTRPNLQHQLLLVEADVPDRERRRRPCRVPLDAADRHPVLHRGLRLCRSSSPPSAASCSTTSLQVEGDNDLLALRSRRAVLRRHPPPRARAPPERPPWNVLHVLSWHRDGALRQGRPKPGRSSPAGAWRRRRVRPMRRAKIVATLGPACSEPDRPRSSSLEHGRGRRAAQLLARHATSDHARDARPHPRGLAPAIGRAVAVLQDLQGPKIRTGPLARRAGGRRLEPGAELVITTEAEVPGDAHARLDDLPAPRRGRPRRATGSSWTTASSSCASSRPTACACAPRWSRAASSASTRASTCPAWRSAPRR